ncbi:hypothetical protein ACK1M2_002557 [Providencia rettgeri]
MNSPRLTQYTGTPIQQIKLVSAILFEISNQHPGIKISQNELNAITVAANDICAAFLTPVTEGNNND